MPGYDRLNFVPATSERIEVLLKLISLPSTKATRDALIVQERTFTSTKLFFASSAWRSMSTETTAPRYPFLYKTASTALRPEARCSESA